MRHGGLPLKGRLTLRYTLALAMVAAFTLASYALVERTVAAQEVSARLLNVAGRQRMLCQRVDVLLLRAAQAAGAERAERLAELAETLRQFRAGHEMLARGPAQDLGMAEDSPTLAQFREQGKDLEALTHGFLEDAGGLRTGLARDNGAPSEKTLADIRRVNAMGDTLLTQLDQRMDALQRMGETTLSSLGRLISLLSLAALAGLLGAAVFVFRPMVTGVVRTQEHLESMNRNLLTQASTDTLTKAFNRRAWDLELTKEFAKAERQQLPLCLIMTDLDHFKRVNDVHGHQRGDRVLKEFTARLREAVRVSDSLFRLGGEEFALLLPGTNLEQGLVAAEKLRARVEALPLDKNLPITASFGLAVTTGGESPDEFVRRADQALYAAKTGGRNRVEALDRTV